MSGPTCREYKLRPRGTEIAAIALIILCFGSADARSAVMYDASLFPGTTHFRPFVASFTFAGVPTPAASGDGLLTVTATGDINNNIETVGVHAETVGGTFLGDLFDDMFFVEDPITLTDTISIPNAVLQILAADSEITFAFEVPESSATCCVTFDEINLTYPVVPIPGAVWLFLSAIFALIAAKRGRFRTTSWRN